MSDRTRNIALVALAVIVLTIVVLSAVADLPETFEQLAGVGVGAIAGLVAPRNAVNPKR